MPKIIENLETRLIEEAGRQICEDDFTADFLAEALLTWTMAGKAFDEIYNLMEKHF
jgi:hypothetical protein